MTLNLAPMVDVMMCLIIFFLLAARLVQREHYAVNLPWAVAAKTVETQELGDRVTINVRKAGDGEPAADYVVVDWDGERIIERTLDADGMVKLLRTRAARAEAAHREIRCVIRADRDVQYQHVETVLRACGLTHVKNVVFSAIQGTEPGSAGGS
jgi:biopolymer transport protein ExbD